MEKLKYPIGKVSLPEDFDSTLLLNDIKTLIELPILLDEWVVKNEDKLSNQYREGSWTAAQVINHIADSHLNGYLRCRHAITESTPSILTYDQNRWAEFEDSKMLDVNASLSIIAGLHARWSIFFNQLSDQQWHCDYDHPGAGRKFTMYQALANYAWHSKHHYAHLEIISRNETK